MAGDKGLPKHEDDYKNIHVSGKHYHQVNNRKKKQSSQSSKLAQGPSSGGGGD